MYVYLMGGGAIPGEARRREQQIGVKDFFRECFIKTFFRRCLLKFARRCGGEMCFNTYEVILLQFLQALNKRRK